MRTESAKTNWIVSRYSNVSSTWIQAPSTAGAVLQPQRAVTERPSFHQSPATTWRGSGSPIRSSTPWTTLRSCSMLPRKLSEKARTTSSVARADGLPRPAPPPAAGGVDQLGAGRRCRGRCRPARNTARTRGRRRRRSRSAGRRRSRVAPRASARRTGRSASSSRPGRPCPARSRAATIASASASVMHIGFSTKTCRPASRAASTTSAWVPAGEQTTIASTLAGGEHASGSRRAGRRSP